MQEERHTFRIFAQALYRSVWAYLTAASTVLTVMLLPRQWHWAVPTGLALIVIIGAFRALAELRREIDRLKVKPYDDEHKKVAEGKLRQLGAIERDLLRYLLHHQPVERQRLYAASKLHDDQSAHSLTLISQTGLAEFHPDATYRFQYWRAREQFVAVLKDLLFPRQEPEEQRHFLP